MIQVLFLLPAKSILCRIGEGSVTSGGLNLRGGGGVECNTFLNWCVHSLCAEYVTRSSLLWAMDSHKCGDNVQMLLL